MGSERPTTNDLCCLRCLWRLKCFDQAAAVFTRMLPMNRVPSFLRLRTGAAFAPAPFLPDRSQEGR